MKIYLASKFDFRNKVARIADELTGRGLEITCKWWLDNIKGMKVTDAEWYKHPSVVSIANRDFKGIDDADAIILISSEDTPMSFNGANIELGYAIAKGKKVFVLGIVDRSALYSKAIFCKDEGQLLKELMLNET